MDVGLGVGGGGGGGGKGVNGGRTGGKGVVRQVRRRKGEGGEDGDEEGGGGVDAALDESEVVATPSPSPSFADADVLDVAWNADSDVLALLVHHPSSSSPSSPPHSSIHLYASSNHHYQLKAEVDLIPGPPSTLSLLWDPDRPLHLLTISQLGEVHSLSFEWDVDVSLTPSRWAAVIEGVDVKLTPLARTLIPPPLCYASITFPSPVVGLSFAPPLDRRDATPLCVVCADASVHVLPNIDPIPRRSHLPLTSLPHLSFSLLTLPYPLPHFRLPLLLPTSTPSGFSLVGVNARIGGTDEVVELSLPPPTPPPSPPPLAPHRGV